MNTKRMVLGLMVLGLGIMGDAWAVSRKVQHAAVNPAVNTTQAPTPASTLQKTAQDVATEQRVVGAFTHKPTSAPPPQHEESKLLESVPQRGSRDASSRGGESSRQPQSFAGSVSYAGTQEGREARARLDIKMFRLVDEGTREQMMLVLDWLNEWNTLHQ